jgi:hypothetical protein
MNYENKRQKEKNNERKRNAREKIIWKVQRNEERKE